MKDEGAIPIKGGALLVRKAASVGKRARFGLKPQLVAARKTQGTAVNDIARHLRAQIPSSTDPDRLERLAREAEGRTAQCQHPTRAHPVLVGTGRNDRLSSASAMGTSRSKSRRMRDGLVVIAACAGLIACTPPDIAHWPIFLPPPTKHGRPCRLPCRSSRAGRSVSTAASKRPS
jgi:hypothetical protein